MFCVAMSLRSGQTNAATPQLIIFRWFESRVELLLQAGSGVRLGTHHTAFLNNGCAAIWRAINGTEI